MKEFKVYVDRSDVENPVLREKRGDGMVVIGGEDAAGTFRELMDSCMENEDHRPGIYEQEGTDYLAIMADEISSDGGETVIDAASMSWCIGVGYDGI